MMCHVFAAWKKINISFNGCPIFWVKNFFFNFSNTGLQEVRFLNNAHHEKCFIIKEHILITWILCTVQKCKKKTLSFQSHHSCFYSSLFDYSLSQIPGQSEPQELHFGQLNVFILKWQMHSKKKHNGLNVTLQRTLILWFKYTLQH